MATGAIHLYLKELEKDLAAGLATEHSYRPALKALVESFGTEITATNEPKRVKCGAPDFVVTRGETPLGYIETKDVACNLDEEERTEQMGRYLEGLNNLILTDYLEFRWYEGGQHRMAARLAMVGAKGKLRKQKRWRRGAFRADRYVPQHSDPHCWEAKGSRRPHGCAGAAYPGTHFPCI